jgi:hypothetical protein
MNSLSTRDKRALLLLVVVILPTLVWYFGFSDAESAAPADVQAAGLSIPVMERRLQNLRQQAALNPAKEEVRTTLEAAVAEREQGLLRGETAQQVQAALLSKVREVLEKQEPPLRARQSDLGAIERISEDYGEVTITVGFGCTVEQLVNVLADIAAIDQMVATKQISILAADRAKKTLNVRLTVSAMMPGSLAPAPTGGILQ